MCSGSHQTARKYSIGYRGGIDQSFLLQVARRVSGLSQAELARLAGTSQATVSTYERGLKSPSLKVAARLLGVMGWEFTLQLRVDFHELHPHGIVAFWVPNRLWRVPTPNCFSRLHIPDLLQFTEQNTWDLRDLTDRRRAYEILIRCGSPQQMIRWLDGGFLVELWDELDLPDSVRQAWAPAMRTATRGRSVDSLSYFDEPLPESGPLATIGKYESLPPQPPPPPPRRSRFDPRP